MRKNTRKIEATSLRIQKWNDRKESSKTFHRIQNKFNYDLIRIFKINQIAQKIQNLFYCSLNSTSNFSPFEFHISYQIYSSSQISQFKSNFTIQIKFHQNFTIQFNSNCIKFLIKFEQISEWAESHPTTNKQTYKTASLTCGQKINSVVSSFKISNLLFWMLE